MQFVLAREKQEAERRRIEAQGIADFQRTVSQGIDERLLRWKGIEATEKLAASQNTKVVIVGAGKDGLPVILGGQ
jgi:regulator of protease activity HflC (stomatin/prohibitin superfamily)